VNLIPFNPWPGSPFETSGNSAIERFAKIVMAAGFASPVRSPRGRDILAACGQLRTAEQMHHRRDGGTPRSASDRRSWFMTSVIA
jgi:23S rRNA (adenine2503-C2)-methyltransferase